MVTIARALTMPENGCVPVDDDANAAPLQKVAIEKRKLEERLARERRILRRKREAAEVNGGDSHRGDALNEIVFVIKERTVEEEPFRQWTLRYPTRDGREEVIST